MNVQLLRWFGKERFFISSLRLPYSPQGFYLLPKQQCYYLSSKQVSNEAFVHFHVLHKHALGVFVFLNKRNINVTVY